ncbi:MAG: winged helix-turn-helix domain-containing protein [Bifidobacteriaceae bacterium]|jgi:DNA-binding response OmpR family regulator|nr:winged helix-turn-helix domain-containing protein [Bifidobacteriaceae bacterium]
MTAYAYAPVRRPFYRSPLIVIPGQRSAQKQGAKAVWRSTPVLRQDSVRSVRSVRSFEDRLNALPQHLEIQLDLERRAVVIDGSVRHLTPREFGLLSALAAQPGQPVSRQTLLDASSGGTDTGQGSRAVDVHVAHLREKLGVPGAIATVRGCGYALNPSYRVAYL